MPSTVAIVEDNTGLREMLSRVVRKTAGFELLGSFPDGDAALQKLPALAPNIVIMDIQLPGMSGIECTRQLKAKLPSVQVLMLTVFEDSDLVFKALAAGASGYLLKRSSRTEIIEAMEQVRDGGAPMTGEIARKVVESFRRPSAAKHSATQQLTPSEEQVLGLLAKGYATKEIADKLSVSLHTVRFHLKNIYGKLHVRSRTEALLKYLE
ncbi:MAG TPA: response regulator transcription factor [Opitutaceae bacterium]|nr:response regulator transcription factor [Opitutaceae bacterium]